MDQWINQGAPEGDSERGLWLSGDNIATDFATAAAGPKPNFLANTLSASLVASSYREFSGHGPNEAVTCRLLTSEFGCADMEDSGYPYVWREYANAVYLYGSACPPRYNYDVLDYGSGTGDTQYLHIYDRTDQTYPPCGLGATIYHSFPAAFGDQDSVKTILDGYSLHALGQNAACGEQYPGQPYWIDIALMLKDRLGDAMGNGCPFASQDDLVQYCPPVYPDNVTGIERRTPRTYANALFQNYPNPFRGVSGTTIHYSVARAGRVEVRVFDVAGRLVNTIVDQARPGDNFITWDGKTKDGRSVASGVYFYQIKTDDFRAQKKMMLVN
jgi:hypothetical protein